MAGWKLGWALLLVKSVLASAFGASVTLEWDPSPSPNVAGYHLYSSSSPGGDFRRVTVELVRGTRFTDSALEPGVTYFYVCTAVGTNGLESTFSNQIRYTAPSSGAPPPPADGDAPQVVLVASDDDVVLSEDTVARVEVLANDQWDGRGGLAVSLSRGPEHGTAAVQGDRSIRYEPAPDFAGTDQFRYALQDVWGRRAEATVTLRVTPVNDPPKPEEDWAFTAVGTAVTINVLQNDTDPENDPLELVTVDPPSRGNLTFQTDGRVTYHPDPGFRGAERIRYVVSDGSATTDGRLVVEVQTYGGDPQLSVVPVAVEAAGPLFADTFVGAAAVNPVPQTTAVRIEASADDGTGSVSATAVLPPGSQLSRLTSEWSDLAAQSSYLTLRDPSSRIATFFLVGDFSLGRLDGLGGRPIRGRRIVIPEVISSHEAVTLIQVVNTGDQRNALKITLYAQGANRPIQWRGNLPGWGSLRATLQQIFGGGYELSGYLEIAASEPVEAFAVTASEQWLSVVGGQAPLALRTRYAPHVAVGDGLDSRIRWVNLDHREAELLAVLLDDRGRTVAETTVRAPAGAQLEISAAELLEEVGLLHFSGSALLYSSTNPPPLGVASATFTSPEGRSSLPLTSSTFTRAVLPHVAVDPERSVATGLVLFNPTLSMARVRLRLFAASGVPVREAEVQLKGRERLAGLLDEATFFGSGWLQLGGYLMVESNFPIVGAAGFSTAGGASMSLVELERLEE